MHHQFRRNSRENASDVHQHDNNADCENSLREFIETICFDLAASESAVAVQRSTVKTWRKRRRTGGVGVAAHETVSEHSNAKVSQNLIFQLMLLFRMRILI